MSLTPYVLRFKEFEYATTMLTDQYNAQSQAVTSWNNSVVTSGSCYNADTDLKKCPDYPKFEEILSLARRIQSFVDSNSNSDFNFG